MAEFENYTNLKIVIIILLIILAFLYFNTNTKKENYVPIEATNKTKIEKIKTPNLKFNNRYFYEQTFHNDYRNLMTIINLINGQKKFIFNTRGLPIRYNTNITPEIKNLAQEFINYVNNKKLDTKIKNWDNVMPDISIQSGFEKSQLSLGLTPTIYKTNQIISPIKIIKIVECEKMETINEIQIQINLIVGKKDFLNDDHLLLSIIYNKNKIKLEDDLLSHKIKLKSEYVLTNASMLGIYSKLKNIQSYDKMESEYQEAKEHNMDPKNEITPISKELEFIKKHYETKAKDNEYINSLIDEEGKVSNSYVNYMDEYPKHQERTINGKKKFY